MKKTKSLLATILFAIIVIYCVTHISTLTSPLETFFLYIVLAGLCLRQMYWSFFGLIRSWLRIPITGLVIFPKIMYPYPNRTLMYLVISLTFIGCIGWVLISLRLTYLAIQISNSLDWHKWLFLGGGFMLAFSYPESPVQTNELDYLRISTAFPTIVISYIIGAFIIAYLI